MVEKRSAMTGVSLELITDIDKYLMVEKGLRVGGWGGGVWSVS